MHPTDGGSGHIVHCVKPALSIAVAVLTRNEEINIVRCLNSVSWCDERIVVDSGSTDRTCELAELSGARVALHRQEGAFNIAKQRNWTLNSAGIKADWVLFLDADEEVTPELRAAICKILENKKTAFNAFQLTPRYYYWGRWLRRTQGFPNWHARLVRREEAGFVGGVWEHFDERARIGYINEPYNHYANSKGLSDWLTRHDRYSSWDAERIVAYLETGDPLALGTARKTRLRLLAARLYPLRPFARFIHMYFLRLGFVEGLPALIVCNLYFAYECMTVIKVIELRRLGKGEPI